MPMIQNERKRMLGLAPIAYTDGFPVITMNAELFVKIE